MGQAPRAIATFLDRAAATLRARGVSEVSLAEVAGDLKQLAAELALPHRDYPVACAGEDIVYELAGDPVSGIALYLVSDAPGTRSPPHDHCTWAVIVGIDGTELNTVYKVSNAQMRRVEPFAEVVLGKGQALVL